MCRYASKSKRLATCEYKHNISSEEHSLKAQIKCLEAKIKELKALYANKNGIQMTLKSIGTALESTSATGIEGTHT